MPSQSEWGRHKAEILALNMEGTLKDVVGMMNAKGFMATASQYEAQLKRWGIRKNLKQHEWRAVFRRYDVLASQHQKVRLLIQGRVIHQNKIQKHRQRYCHGPSYLPASDTRAVIPECVSFETLDAGQQWSPCTAAEEQQILHQPSASDGNIEGIASSVVEPPSPSNLFDSSSPGNQPRSEPALSAFGQELDAHQSHAVLQSFDANGIESSSRLPDFNFLPGMSDMTPHDPPWSLTPRLTEELSFTDMTLWPPPCGVMSPGSISSSTPRQSPFELLQGLPFSQFEKMLEVNGINLQTHLAKSSTTSRVFGHHNPVTMFILDAAEVQSAHSGIMSCNVFAQRFDASLLLPSFGTLLPGEALQEEQETDHGPLSRNRQFENNFLRLLTYSAVNGFPGLERIPISTVPKFLARYANVGDLLLQILKASPPHTAKALAENLFKAAIEAQEEKIIRRLLSTRLVDVNMTVCDVAGEKFTAIERAAVLQNTAMAVTLLNLGADVNKTFAAESDNGGSLTRLICGVDTGATITPSIINLAQVLLRAGAAVACHALMYASKRLHSEELIYLVVPTAAKSDHTMLISHGSLIHLARQPDHEKASQATASILQSCEVMHSGLCLNSDQTWLTKAMTQGAINGNVQFVRSLLPYTHVDYLHKVLSASVRGRNRELIDLLLAKVPDTNAIAADIDHLGADKNLTTPLAEAIKTRDIKLIRLFEGLEALKYLQGGKRFSTAMAAAAKVGDLEYIHKLLRHHPSPDPKDMSLALFHSIENGHEEVSWFLLDAGADVNYERGTTDTLFAAVLQRNKRLIREILDADVCVGASFTSCSQSSEGRFYSSTVFDEVIRWGDQSMILDLKSALHRPRHHPHTIKGIFETGNDSLFRFLLEERLVRKQDLTVCLEVAVKRGDAKMLYNLTDWGADPLDSRILAFAAHHRAEMLPLLLKYIAQPNQAMQRGFGLAALRAAIERGLAGLEAVNILLSSKAIDIDAMCGKGVPPLGGEQDTNPLGLAIRESKSNNHGDFAIVRSLLKAGCNPNIAVAVEEYAPVAKLSALLAAIRIGNKELVELLIDHNADIHAKPGLGSMRSPLQYAAELGYLSIANLLLNHGADPNTPPAIRNGGTALQFAAKSGDCNMAAELLSRGADLRASPSKVNGRWPLEAAAEHGRLDMIEFLWKASGTGFDDEQCKRATMLAESNGFLGCRDFIIELSASRVFPLQSFSLTDISNM